MQEKKKKTAIEILATLNRLNLKAFSSPSLRSLKFTMLNETIHVLQYKRALLWNVRLPLPSFQGVSGGGHLSGRSSEVIHWKKWIQDLKYPEKVQILTQESFLSDHSSWENYLKAQKKKQSVLWLPIICHQKVSYALCLERDLGDSWRDDEVELLCFLVQGYGIALEKFTGRSLLRKLLTPVFIGILLFACSLLFLVQLPLRVVAPCEIVPDNPIRVTAPLPGIIQEIHVDPGNFIEEGALLFSYDDRIANQELKIAEKQVEMTASELHRTMTFAFRDPMQLARMGLLSLELQKEELAQEYAKKRVGQLEVKASFEGVIILDDPEVWRGRPVEVGEHILMISDPEQTKVRMWIPEGDNIVIDPLAPVTVFLNVDPATSHYAKLKYISDYVALNEQGINSFAAEAEWEESEEEVLKLGLKGHAILYGEKVSLFYWLMRKPWNAVRKWTGF